MTSLRPCTPLSSRIRVLSALNCRSASLAVAFGCAALLPFVPVHAASIAASDILVYQVGNSTTTISAANTPIFIQELNPSLTSQTTPVQSFSISTSTTSLWGNSDASAGVLNLSDNNTLLTFSSWVGEASTENNILTRGAGVIDALGNYTQPSASDYTSSATNSQSRAAYSADGTTFYFADKEGIYTNGGTTALNTANIRSLKEFGGVTYALSQSGTELSSVSIGGSTATLTGLTGLSSDSKANDFVLLSSGANGSTFDTLYIEDNSSSSGKLNKYALIGTTWTLESASSINNLDFMTGKVDSNGHFDLYLTLDTGSGSSTVGTVEEITDSAAYNATASLNTATVLYTAPTGDSIQGVALAPVPEPSTWMTVFGGLGVLTSIRFFRRRPVYR